ncbi:helix-turn-helix domain-containing protein [Algoriphagus sp.]|uniref:helix-turn-helix domain-containing protein n=1 Tax=Algoriphagus sp. TaxID=1872435 RepID=UPI0025D62E84|nr:helix-turn-helix domain-containing protein [Algoriphagus sp.]
MKEIVPSAQTLIWILEKSELKIDGKLYSFHEDEVICLTEFHQVEIINIRKARLVRFNRPFFCILDHDSEIGCKGILFFGSSQLPIITLSDPEKEKLETLWNIFYMEIQETRDSFQLEMLQMLLKRLLIICTRIFKKQKNYNSLNHKQTDLIREYNFLVEKHFREKRSVTDYAEMLNKSPKTIANLFSKLGAKSPLSFIQDRTMLEAKRMLSYTDKPVKEIGYDLGFEDIQAFSRFFKNIEGISPSEFKDSYK